MSRVSVTRSTNLPREAIWTVLADFPNIGRWSSGVRASKPTTKATAGVGAARHCDFTGKGYVQETVRTWDEGQGYFVDFTDTDAPMRNAGAGFRLKDNASGGTDVTFEMEYQMKMGPLGALMNVLMVRRQLRGNGSKVLSDLEAAARRVHADPSKA